MKVKDTSEFSQPPQEIQVEHIQPWSNMICKFKLPDHVFERLWELYDYTMGIKWKSFGGQLVGQIDEEPEVTPDILEKFPEWGQWCIQSVEQFIQTQMRQSVVGSESPDDFFKQKLLTRLTTMWFVNQKPHEYNPVHIHTNCKVSSVVYLKTPKNQIKGRKNHYQSDGKITFMNNSGTDMNFANCQCSFEPKAGDMYIFPALQHHMVWPYRSTDPDDSRISLSFNADFTSEKQLEEQQKKQEQMFEQMKKMKESENDKSTTDGNINKSG